MGRLLRLGLLVSMVSGCGLATGVQTGPVTPPASPGTGAPLPATHRLAVTSAGLNLDGNPFVPRGVSLAGFIARYRELGGPYVDARDAFGPDELSRARGLGADTLRLVISQTVLAPPVGFGGLAYRRTLHDAVVQARALGFVVILALDDSSLSGDSQASGLPDAATAAAWAAIAPQYASDAGVAFELFRSPVGDGTAASWGSWQSGIQRSLDAVRGAGATNVVIADGLDHGHTLAGAPQLDDPAGQLVYGVEPYPHAGDGPQSWTADFGTMAARAPVVATEWDAPSRPPLLDPTPQVCDQSTPQLAADLLAYLRAHRIGLIGYAFDLPGTLVRDTTGALTSYDGLSCGTYGWGPGGLLQTFFHQR